MDPADLDVAAVEALCAALRRVIRAARSTTAPAPVLHEARRLAEQLAALLEPHEHPGPYSQGELGPRAEAGPLDAESVRDPAALFPYSPIIGPRNPIAPPVPFRVEDGAVRGEVRFAPQYTGPPGSVHGGVIALVLDELLGYVNVANLTGGFTGTLTVRYRALTPIDTPLALEGHSVRTEGRKLYARGSLRHGETVTAEAEGLFIRPQRAAK